MKKNAGQCFSNESEATNKNSADLEEKKTPKTLLNIKLYQALQLVYLRILHQLSFLEWVLVHEKL